MPFRPDWDLSRHSGESAMFRGEAVRDFRHKLGWSRQQLASYLGVSLKEVTSWETGRSRPPNEALGALYRLADSTLIPFDPFRTDSSSLRHPRDPFTDPRADPGQTPGGNQVHRPNPSAAGSRSCLPGGEILLEVLSQESRSALLRLAGQFSHREGNRDARGIRTTGQCDCVRGWVPKPEDLRTCI